MRTIKRLLFMTVFLTSLMSSGYAADELAALRNLGVSVSYLSECRNLKQYDESVVARAVNSLKQLNPGNINVSGDYDKLVESLNEAQKLEFIFGRGIGLGFLTHAKIDSASDNGKTKPCMDLWVYVLSLISKQNSSE